MILKGTPGTIKVQFGDADNPADPGVTTVKVDRADGTNLVPALTATGGTGTAPRTFALTTTDTATVDALEATWTSSTHGTVPTSHEVIGGFYVDLMTLRAAGDLSDQTRFPDETLDAARDWWADLVDDYCKQSFVPRYRRQTFRLASRDFIRLDRRQPRTILSATLDGAAITTIGWLMTASGGIYLDTALSGVLAISYEHGWDRPDGELYGAGVKAMRAKLLDDRTGGPLPRQLSITNEFGTTRFSQPGAGRATPWPDVNAVLNRRRANRVMVA